MMEVLNSSIMLLQVLNRVVLGQKSQFGDLMGILYHGFLCFIQKKISNIIDVSLKLYLHIIM